MPPRLQHPSRILISTTTPAYHPHACILPTARCAFHSTTPSRLKTQTKLRRDFFEWINGPGAVFQQPPQPGNTNYLSAYDVKTGEPKEGNNRGSMLPFPLNYAYPSTPVVSDELASEVYLRVVESGKSVRMVSAELNISLDRVAAIVRLKTIEKRWEKEEKPLKPFLTKAMHSMLPTTPLQGPSIAHEPINDLPSHPRTHTQTFVPVSESRVYTRADAGAEFGLPPADEMIPHPELIEDEKDRSRGLSVDERRAQAQQREKAEEQKKKEQEEARAKRQQEAEIILESGRWRWRLQQVETGKVGFRYGVPHQDRKKGQVKIPTRVE